ncbi:MAG: hypothetical protein ABI472_07960 [Ginsengibacter sp.]
MKKIITLLFSVGVFATSFAQNNPGRHDRDDRYVYNRNDHFDKRGFSERDRYFQVERINRKFEFKVRAIQNDRRLRRHQKKVAIRNAERERSIQIQMLNARSREWQRGHGNYDKRNH